MKKEILLSNGSTKVVFDDENLDPFFEGIVKNILIPFYKQSKDWNAAIRKSISELDVLRGYYDLPIDPKHSKMLLKKIHAKLKDEIADLKGVDDIEILFLNMDDYIIEINELISDPSLQVSKEERVRTLGKLIAQLNTFELSELIYHYAEKALKK